MAPVLGAPELVVPGENGIIPRKSRKSELRRAAGQIRYKSRVSGKYEALPVCVSVMGLPGMKRS